MDAVDEAVTHPCSRCLLEPQARDTINRGRCCLRRADLRLYNVQSARSISARAALTTDRRKAEEPLGLRFMMSTARAVVGMARFPRIAHSANLFKRFIVHQGYCCAQCCRQRDGSR
ncbi:hypothetical protein C8035_v008650 [Colletotrichum spinosum]|uniref:Uncharacterized protein n=1 Tax=Colletotrichum spinosum TaxID=1347390 RepID=A0A4R8PQD8_9PEZI|nr:hypothetical protein C8035_v008650 [Colletotrichum spinosum]